MTVPRRISAALGALALFALAGTAADARDLTVFAAASLKGALDEITERYEAETGDRVRVSYAGSSILARQIEFGAPADVFISANSDWMDRLEDEGLIEDATRFDLISNRLVVIAPAPAEAMQLSRLAAQLDGAKLAVALVDAVPAGLYAKAALTQLKLWDDFAPHLAQTDNVRAALALVARREAAFGIVYASDAAAEPAVAIVAEIPATSHPTIRYPVAALRGGKDAANFLRTLQSAETRAFLAAQGFHPLPRPPEGPQ